jgi:hypothetical protein
VRGGPIFSEREPLLKRRQEGLIFTEHISEITRGGRTDLSRTRTTLETRRRGTDFFRNTSRKLGGRIDFSRTRTTHLERIRRRDPETTTREKTTKKIDTKRLKRLYRDKWCVRGSSNFLPLHVDELHQYETGSSAIVTFSILTFVGGQLF